jgi:hypothetical protein
LGITEQIRQLKIPPNLSEETIYTQKLIPQLANGKNLGEIPGDISFEEFCKAMEKWNERTTTSPSGRHLGHYKVLLKIPVFNENDPINLSLKILNTYYQMIMIDSYSNNNLVVGATLAAWQVIRTIIW